MDNINIDDELNYYMAQEITKSMYLKNLISTKEYVILTKINRIIFVPYLAEIMPNPLDLFPEKR